MVENGRLDNRHRQRSDRDRRDPCCISDLERSPRGSGTTHCRSTDPRKPPPGGSTVSGHPPWRRSDRRALRHDHRQPGFARPGARQARVPLRPRTGKAARSRTASRSNPSFEARPSYRRAFGCVLGVLRPNLNVGRPRRDDEGRRLLPRQASGFSQDRNQQKHLSISKGRNDDRKDQNGVGGAHAHAAFGESEGVVAGCRLAAAATASSSSVARPAPATALHHSAGIAARRSQNRTRAGT